MIPPRAAPGAALLALLVAAAGLAPGGAAGAEEGVPRNSFSRPLPGLAGDELARFALGRAQFRTIRLAGARADGNGGLGPVFNRTSCSGCHVRNGRGRPPEDARGPLTTMVVRLGPGSKYGRQLNDKAIPGVEPEGRAVFLPNPVMPVELGGVIWPLRSTRVAVREPAFGPLTPHVELSPRVAPQIAGTGLLERIPDAMLRELADPGDRNGDGISGRRGGPGAGRFGWRAEVPTVEAQVAAALHQDMGVTSTLRRSANCAAGHSRVYRSGRRRDRDRRRGVPGPRDVCPQPGPAGTACLARCHRRQRSLRCHRVCGLPRLRNGSSRTLPSE